MQVYLDRSETDRDLRFIAVDRKNHTSGNYCESAKLALESLTECPIPDSYHTIIDKTPDRYLEVPTEYTVEVYLDVYIPNKNDYIAVNRSTGESGLFRPNVHEALDSLHSYGEKDNFHKVIDNSLGEYCLVWVE